MGALSRLRRGALAAGATQVIAAGGQALVVPLYLASWGEERYGEWLTLSAAAAWASLADLGFSSHVVNRLNAERARGAERDFARTLHSALGFSLLASLAAFALLATLALFVPFDAWFGFSATGRRTATMAAVLLCLQITAAIPRGLLLGLYRALGEYARGAWLANLERALYVAITAGVLIFGGGLVALAAAQLAPLAASAALGLRDLARRHPQVRVGVAERVPGLARALVGPSLLFLGVQAGLVLVLQGSTLVLGLGLGPAAVALFASQRTLANLVRQVAGSFCNVLWPELTTWSARGEADTLRAVHRLAVKSFWTLGLAGGAVLVLCGPDLLRAWTGGRLQPDRALFVALAAHLAVQAPWRASSYALLATSRCGELALRQLAAGALGLGLGALALARTGPAGLVAALVVGELCFCAAGVPRRVCRELGEPWPAFARGVLGRGFLVAALVGLAALGLDPLLAPWTPGARVGAALVTAAALPAALAWRLWLDPEERDRVARALGLAGRNRTVVGEASR